MLVCEELNLPHPPQDLIDDLYQQIDLRNLTQIPRQAKKFEEIPQFLTRSVTYNNHTAVSRVQKRYVISDELIAWADNNLPKGLIDFNVAISDGDSLHGPHLDYNRHYSLLYLLEGNIEAVNSWWQKKGYDAEFNSNQWPSTSSDYDDLTLIFQKKLKPRTWYLLNTFIYHSVENLTGRRVSLQGDYQIW